MRQNPRTAAGRFAAAGRFFRSARSTRRAAKRSARSRRSRRSPRAAYPSIGLEPSCLLGFRDEIPALIKSKEADALAQQTFLLEEFLARESKAGRLKLPLGAIGKRALLHGHCHQKAFAALTAVQQVLALVPGLEVETVESSCCGMAGAFGYGADTIDVSLKMGELSLLPAVREAAA